MDEALEEQVVQPQSQDDDEVQLSQVKQEERRSGRPPPTPSKKYLEKDFVLFLMVVSLLAMVKLLKTLTRKIGWFP